MELDQIKQKIRASSILSDSEKQEWLFLLPKMTDPQKQELVRILEVRMPVGITEKPSTPSPSPPYQGGEKRGGEPIPVATFSPTTPPLDFARGTPPRAGGEGASMLNTKYDILNTSIEAMRSAPSVYDFFDHLAAQMVVKVKTNAAAEAVIAEFQQSPLHRAYVASGKEMLEGREPQGLTRSEFEAIAEFRASLKKVLQGT